MCVGRARRHADFRSAAWPTVARIHNSLAYNAGPPPICLFPGYAFSERASERVCVDQHRRRRTMRRKHLASVGAVVSGVFLAGGAVVGSRPRARHSHRRRCSRRCNKPRTRPAAVAAATNPPPSGPAQPRRPQRRQRATIRWAAVGAAPVPLGSDHGTRQRNRQHAAAGAGLDLGDEHDDKTSPLANVNAPVNACSLSVGLVADASSSCSTTSVGLNQAGAIGNVNVPVTAQDNAIGLLGQAASALGLTTGQAPSSTTQNGAVNADVPVSLCSVNVGLVGATSDCTPGHERHDHTEGRGRCLRAGHRL